MKTLAEKQKEILFNYQKQHQDAFYRASYDVIVIGAGHAGIEAALAASRMGKKTLLTTLNLENLALLPCNPSIGGPAKSQLVREIDALGGQMAQIADQSAIEYRLLNTGKGPAVHSLRAQIDKNLYHIKMKEICENEKNLDLKQLLIDDLILDNNKVYGIYAETGEIYLTDIVILATGTYLNGTIIIGSLSYEAGPNGQRSAKKLRHALERAGIRLQRLKTGTPPRVHADTIKKDALKIQETDEREKRFSFYPPQNTNKKISCYITYTNERTHQIIKENLARSPLYNGLITGEGPRYCPSVETKIMRFPDKDKHQIFLEPEGLHTKEIYVQGMSTSMPADVQIAFINTIQGLENAQIMRLGYAIEYDAIDSTSLYPTLEFKNIEGLFAAGQINGTSGYEEAASQGLIAGINAVLKLEKKTPFILKRSEAYIGVLIDDLVTKGTKEPYRMMTSRAEYRLILREDNADLRLTPYGKELGLIKDERYQKYLQKKQTIDEILALLLNTKITPNKENQIKITKLSIPPLKTSITLKDLLKRQELTYQKLIDIFHLPQITKEIAEEIEIMIKYEGYIQKQQEQINRVEKMENKILPNTLDYNEIVALSKEGREKLMKIRPHSLGQANRITGISAADISILLVYLTQQERKNKHVSRETY